MLHILKTFNLFLQMMIMLQIKIQIRSIYPISESLLENWPQILSCDCRIWSNKKIKGLHITKARYSMYVALFISHYINSAEIITSNSYNVFNFCLFTSTCLDHETKTRNKWFNQFLMNEVPSCLINSRITLIWWPSLSRKHME